MAHQSIPELSQAVEEIKGILTDIENPSKEYKENLDKAIQQVKNDILSISDTFESIKQSLTDTTKDIFAKIEELGKSVQEFKSNSVLAPTEEFKDKVSKSFEELTSKFEGLLSPADSIKESFIAELKEIRQQIYDINHPSIDNKKISSHNLLESIEGDDILKTKFAKTVLGVSHPEDFVFPPEQIEVIPALTTLKVNWETVKFAELYKVFIAKSGETNYKQLQDTNYTTITIPGLSPDTEYSIYIIAGKISGQISSSSKIVTATTLSNK